MAESTQSKSGKKPRGVHLETAFALTLVVEDKNGRPVYNEHHPLKDGQRVPPIPRPGESMTFSKMGGGSHVSGKVTIVHQDYSIDPVNGSLSCVYQIVMRENA